MESVKTPANSPSPRPETWKAFEQRIGTRWTTWLGATAIVVAAALFIKLAVERGWLGPAARFALGLSAGIGLIAGGWFLQRMRVLSHGLFGAGLGVLYVSVYVASATHGLLAPELAFAALVTVTVGGTTLAVTQDSQALAVLAWLGGLATPVLLPGVGTRDTTSIYVLVLAIAGASIAAVRDWRPLAIIAVAGTHVALFTSLMHRRIPGEWERELAWFAISHAAIVITPVAIAVRRRRLAEMWSGLCLLSAFSAMAAAVVIPDIGHRVLGIYTLLFAVGHAALAWVVRRVAADDLSRVTFPLIAIGFATATIPLLTSAAVTTIAWSVEGVILLLLARDPRDAQLRSIALIVVGLAGAHALFAAETAHVTDDRLALIVVPPAAWLFALLHHRAHRDERGLAVTAALGGAALALVGAHVELLQILGPTDGRALVPAVWALGSLLTTLIAGQSRRGHDAAALMVAIGTFLASVAYRDGIATDAIVLNPRCGAALLVLAAIAALRRPGRFAELGLPAALIGLIVLARQEVHDPTALSIAWSVVGALVLALGFATQRRVLRLAGLALLGLVTAKIMLVDLAGASSLLRVISLAVLGVVLIGASYAYHRLTAREP